MSRRALVTGGTRGIGGAIGQDLKKHGYEVIVTHYGNEEKAEEFSKKTGIPYYKWDVSNYDECVQGVKKIENEHGNIDILINNAGITRDAMLHKMDVADWHKVLHTNLDSCFYMSHCVIPAMREKGFGRIVNISSINALKGQLGQTNYCASKAGIIGFTKALALESARKGITVNAIAPGYTNTDMVSAMSEDIVKKIIEQIPVNRLGEPAEIARAVRFLVSDNAGFITGETLNINGAQYCA
jgi:acetoacetyl-CoA reductase